MDSSILVRQFERMGARSVVTEHRDPSGLRVNIRRVGRKACFDLQVGREAEFRVVDVRPELRHLLLLGIDRLGGRTSSCAATTSANGSSREFRTTAA